MKKKKQIKKRKQAFVNENLMNINDLILFLNEAAGIHPLISNLEKFKKNPEASVKDLIINDLSKNITQPSQARTTSIQQTREDLLKNLRSYKSDLMKLQKYSTPTQQQIISTALDKIAEDEKEEAEIAKSIEENKLMNYYWQKMFSAYNTYSNAKNDLNKNLKLKLDPSLEQTMRLWDRDLELIKNKEKTHYQNFLNTLENKEKVAFSCSKFNSPEGQICKKAIDERAAAKEKIVTRFVLQFLGKKVPQEYSIKSREPYVTPQNVMNAAPGILGKIGSGVSGALGRFKQLFTEYKDIPDEVLFEMLNKVNINEQILMEITGYKTLSLKEAMEKEYD